MNLAGKRVSLPDSAAAGAPGVLGALALELASGHVDRDCLSQGDAGVLTACMSRDLGRFAPEATSLDLLAVGAHYDPVELLRPGWPLHRELARLAARAPRAAIGAAQGGRVIAFGAREGRLPGLLAPATEHAGGPFRLVPFVLSGDVTLEDRVAVACERELLQRGMAGADTALAAQDLFGLRIEHARYLTLHDLAAMVALQYEHAGVAALWPLIEAALLAPQSEEWLDAAPEPLLHYAHGEARIAMFAPAAWRTRYAADPIEDETRLERRLEQFEARQRQFAAVLAAHAIPVIFVHCSGATTRDLQAQE